jgi:hypothetical protein
MGAEGLKMNSGSWIAIAIALAVALGFLRTRNRKS